MASVSETRYRTDGGSSASGNMNGSRFSKLPYEERLRKWTYHHLLTGEIEEMLSKFTSINMVYTMLIALTYFHCMNHPVWWLGAIVWNWQREVAELSYELRQNFVGNRVVKLWKNLPEEVVTATTVSCFKGRFDRHSADNRYSMEWKYGPAGNAQWDNHPDITSTRQHTKIGQQAFCLYRTERWWRVCQFSTCRKLSYIECCTIL